MAIKHFHTSENHKIVLPLLYYAHSDIQKAYDYAYFLKDYQQENEIFNTVFNIIEKFTKEKNLLEKNHENLLAEIDKINIYSNISNVSNSEKKEGSNSKYSRESNDQLAYSYKVIYYINFIFFINFLLF